MVQLRLTDPQQTGMPTDNFKWLLGVNFMGFLRRTGMPNDTHQQSFSYVNIVE